MVMRNRRRVEYRFGYKAAGVAQLVEQLICNQPVGGSNPLASSSSEGRKVAVELGIAGPQLLAVISDAKSVPAHL